VAAGVKSYYGIETDVRVTKDGKIIVIHDNDLMRIAGMDVSVEGSTYDDLRKVRLKDIDDVTERADLFLPSLDEYIHICKKYDKQAILELKNSIPKEKFLEVAQRTKELGWFERVTFISNAKEGLAHLRENYPEASIQLICGYCTEEEIQFVLDQGIDADLNQYHLTKEMVEKLRAAGRKVNVWTVNTLEQARAMQALGVDMITTNILE
jgi:glycerophosphoryl diester phosphodiesterase